MDSIVRLMPQIIEGLVITIEVFILTLVISIPLGVVVALCRLSKFKIVSAITKGYILIMRGTPLLLQIIFIFYGLPILDIKLDRLPAVLVAFILNYGAYFGEIFRGGIQSIDEGQYEAGKVLGLTPRDTFIRIILPQSIKRVVPSVANEVITLIKDTALVYVVGMDDLLKVAKIASNRDASLLPFVIVGIVYLLLGGILSKILQNVEKKYEYYK